MKNQGEVFDPDWVISPGETLREWIHENGLSERSTAVTCGLAVRDIQGILSGRLQIRGPLAEHLEQGTQIPAKLWLNLERAYRDGLTTGKTDASARSKSLNS